MPAGASNSPVFTFTSVDFASIQADLIRYAQTRFPADQWTDFNSSNFGSHLIELMAYAADLLAYNANSQALETVASTCIREQNFRNIAKTLDYTLKSAAGSSGNLTVTLDPLGTYPFTISKHLQFGSPIFQPTADVPVASYVATLAFPARQGAEAYNEQAGTSTATAGQKFLVANPYMIDGTLSVSVSGQGFSQVTNFIEVGSTDRVYTVATDEDGVSTVLFGDGVNGAIPPSGSVVFNYFYGGGAYTNVAAGIVTSVYGVARNSGATIPPQILSVTNLSAMSGGADKESLPSARKNLPATLKLNDRAIDLQDFVAIASSVSGVYEAGAVSGKYQSGSNPVLLYVVPAGLVGSDPSDVLRNQVYQAFVGRKLAGKRIRILPPQYVSLLIEQDLFVQSASPAALVQSTMRNLLSAKYGADTASFGAEYGLQDAYDSVDPLRVQGVSRVFYKTFSIIPYYGRHPDKPTTGNGTVEGILTNTDTAKRREWLIRITDADPLAGVFCNQFSVTQRQLGTATVVGDTYVDDTSANFSPNSLVGLQIRPRPTEQESTLVVTGNTATRVTVGGGGLFALLSPGDPYVIEKAESTTGKVLRTVMTGTVALNTLVPVASSTSFKTGDRVRIWQGAVEIRTTVASVPGSSSLRLAVPVTFSSGAIVDVAWTSDDASVSFSVVDGTAVLPALTAPSPFVPDDELYVDTYPKTGDIALRGECFPVLYSENLSINPVGGIQ